MTLLACVVDKLNSDYSPTISGFSFVSNAGETLRVYNENISGSLVGCQRNQRRFASVGASPIKSSKNASITSCSSTTYLLDTRAPAKKSGIVRGKHMSLLYKEMYHVYSERLFQGTSKRYFREINGLSPSL